MLEKWEQQLKLEWSTVETLRYKYTEHATNMRKMGRGHSLMGTRSVMNKWFTKLEEAIRQEQEACRRGDKGMDRLSYGAYLYALEPDVLAVLTMHGVLGSMLTDDEAGRVKLTRVAVNVGKLVNEQIGTENMKRRVDLEARRQRKMAQVQKAMWADHAECLRMGYDWTARRAKWESELKELQSLREDHSRPQLPPIQTSRPLARGKIGSPPTRAMLRNDEMYEQGLSKLDALEEDALPDVDLEPGEEAPAAVIDWFKVDPRYESRVGAIRKRWQKLHKDTGSLTARDKQRALGDEMWGPNMLAKVGVVLTKLLMDTATVEVPDCDDQGHKTGTKTEQPAFWHGLVNGYDEKGKGWWKKFGMVTMHDELLRRLSDEEVANALLPRWMPMLIPPKPWVAPNIGGHISHQSMMMRVRGSAAQVNQLFAAHKDGKLEQIYEALNAMGETAWGINPIILERIQTAYRGMKGGFCGLPFHDSVASAPLPPMPSQVFRSEVKNGQLTANVMNRHSRDLTLWKSEVNKIKKKTRELHSLRCDMSYKLNVAESYLNQDAFYFPHNLDFRGRAYPMHPNLNHLGADLSRGLLQFADAKPLGPDGLRWLEISVANLYGKGADKLSFDGRVEFARNHLHEIFDSADNPFTGSGWWQEADSPWQLLAVCYDVQAALASGNPETYCSRIPVHQDGSCNGLQHYAALGRDESGGRTVNLLPGDKPQDVYSEIAKLVQNRVARDEADGVPEATVLRDNVNRKLVKQTVMTSVYGVTFVGARQQIGNRLKERGWDDERLVYKTSCYGARVTLDCLHQMFDSAKDIMQWLSLCARVVAKADKPVQWTTPLGLPVVQPYRKKSKTHVQTLLQRVILVHQTDASPIQRVRQRSAFPPNFIHSIDSSHMMLTAIACHKAGLSFAGVHDSFWTHAGSVGDMNAILREKFLELHSQPLLQNLRNELLEESPELDIPHVPQLGGLALESITDAKYFFN